MSTSADVRSTQAVADFAAALGTFRAQALNVLSTIAMDLRRMVDWLEEQRQVWARLLRKAEEDFVHARQELARRKMMRIGDRPVATSDQELALARAKARLEHIQEKMARTRAWQQDLPQLILDEQAPLRVLENALESDVPRMRALLDQKLSDLDSYLRDGT